MATYGTLTADGDSNSVYVRGPFLFKASGTWGGGTITVSVKSQDRSTWKELNTDVAMTSDATGEVVFEMPELRANAEVKATLAGATSPSLAWEFFGNVSDNANY